LVPQWNRSLASAIQPCMWRPVCPGKSAQTLACERQRLLASLTRPMLCCCASGIAMRFTLFVGNHPRAPICV